MEELDLKELIQIFWEKRKQILLITAIFIVLGIIYTVGFVKPKYQSKTSLLLATNSSSQSNANGITTNDLTLNSKLVSTYSDMVSGNKIISFNYFFNTETPCRTKDTGIISCHHICPQFAPKLL